MRTKPCLHCLPRGNTNTGPVKTGKNHFREILCGISITPQSDGEAKTSAVRPRKQPYNPRSGSSKADRQAPAAFSFRGLDIRHRLPDAKRSRELLKSARRRSSVYRGFDTPGRCVSVPVPSSVIPIADGNDLFRPVSRIPVPRFGSHLLPSSLRALRFLFMVEDARFARYTLIEG